MKLGYVIHYVTDVTRTIEFYEAAFGLERRFVADGGDYAELETGATTLSFAAVTLAQSNFPVAFRATSPADAPPGFEIGLTTDDVPAAYEKAVKAGAAGIAEPKTKPWGQTVAYVRDCDGALVELCTPMS